MTMKKYNVQLHSKEPLLGRLASPPHTGGFELERAAHIALQVEAWRFERDADKDREYAPDTEIILESD